MCAAESTFDPLLLGDIVVSTFCWIWVVAEDGDDGVAFIEDDESAIEVGYRDEITLDCDGGGHSQAGDDFFDEFTFEAVVDQSSFGLVVSVADEESVWFVAGIEGHTMGGVEFFQSVALGAEVAQVLSVFVVAEDVVRSVSVRQVDLSVFGNRDGCWIKLFEV